MNENAHSDRNKPSKVKLGIVTLRIVDCRYITPYPITKDEIIAESS